MKVLKVIGIILALGALLFAVLWGYSVYTEHKTQVGAVTTAWKLWGANHTVTVDGIDDPDVQGVTCYMSHPRTGGMAGTLRVAEDKSDASLDCIATGEIKVLRPLRATEEVFSTNTSIWFKEQRIVRFVDAKRNTLTYLTYSTKLIDGSPKNSVSAVHVPGAPIPMR